MTEKSMPLGDFRKLKIAMSKTTSNVDGEALVMIRNANDVLIKNGITWDDVLNRSVTVYGSAPSASGFKPTHRVHEYDDKPPEEEVTSTLKEEIEHAFAVLKDSTGKFVSSLRKQYDSNGYLSPRQRASLFEMAKGR